MIRLLMAALAALTISSCASPYRSAVDLAPFQVRPTTSPIAEGLYCIVTVSWRADGEPVNVFGGAADACVRYTWNAARRTVSAEGLAGEDSEPPERKESAVASLGDGLFLMQSDSASAESSIAPYSITLALIEGGAISAIPPIGEAPLRELARRFPAVILGGDPDVDCVSYIKSGDRTYISAYLKEAALLGLGMPDDRGNRTLQMALRVDTPGQETVFTLLKRPDVLAMKARVASLAARAPQGIDLASSGCSPAPPVPVGQ